MNLRALLISLLLPAFAGAAELKVPTTVDAVTVHPGSALVTRQGRAELPSGEVRLFLEELTPQLQDDSLRVSAGGDARARLLGISVEYVPQAETTSPELLAAEKHLRGLERQNRVLTDRVETASKQVQFLDSLRSTYVQERAQNMAVRATDADEWAEMVGVLGRQYDQAQAIVRNTQFEQFDLAREIEAARQKLNVLQSTGRRATKRVVVDLQVERAGDLDVKLSYLVQGASWTPVWDARLDPDRGKVALGLQARVEQRTGEDWKGVRLGVSTATPERRIQVPELGPRYLTLGVPYAPQKHSRAGAMADAPMAAAKSMEMESRDEAFEPMPAQVEIGLLSTSFTSPTRATVPSTGEPRKTFLASYPLEAKLQRIVVPSVEEQAFLVAEAKNGTGVPLLAGPIELFVGDAFVGRTHLGDVPDGAELELAFGPDDRVKVERKVIDRTREDYGVFSKRELIRYRIRTTVKNLYRTPVEVKLVDQIPVARDEDIEVKVLEGTTRATEPEDKMKPGVKEWKMTLKPGEERVIELRYEVSYPQGKHVGGLP